MDFKLMTKNLYRTSFEQAQSINRSSKEFLRHMGEIRPVRNPDDHEPFIPLSKTKHQSSKLDKINQKLSVHKEATLRLADRIAEQKKDLLEREEGFRETFEEFNFVIVQNRQKRERAIMRMMEHDKVIHQRQKDIDHILEEVVKMRKHKELFKEEIRKHIIYVEFIGRIVREFGPNSTPIDVLDRFLTLDSKKRYLTRRNLKANAELNELRKKSSEFTLKQIDACLDMKKKLSQYERRKEESSRKTSQLEFLISNIWDDCNGKLNDLIGAIEAIKSLNKMMLVRQERLKRAFDIPVHREEEVETAPYVIQDVISIRNNMKAVVKITKKVETRMRVVKKLWGDQAGFRQSPVL